MAKNEAQALSNEELEFYSRQIVLPDIGFHGQQRLRDAKVCVAGLGGLGSPAATQLAAMGVGHLRLVDYDVVELSNMQRQHLYGVDCVGYPKVEVAAARLRQLNPYITIEPLPLYVSENNAQDLIGDVDVVVDGLDRMTPRYALNRACVRLGVPYVFGAAIATFGNVSTIIPGETACLECFQGNVQDDILPTCAVAGIHPSVTNLVASIQVSEATRIVLLERPRLASRLLHCDIESLEFEEVELPKAENCPVCGSEPAAPPMPLTHQLVTELCARQGSRTFVIAPRMDLALDMDDLCSVLAARGFDLRISADLGITFQVSAETTASLLQTGIMIVQNAADEEQVRHLYVDLLIEGLGVSLSDVE